QSDDGAFDAKRQTMAYGGCPRREPVSRQRLRGVDAIYFQSREWTLRTVADRRGGVPGRRANLQQPGTDWGQRALQPGLAAGGGFGWHGICVLGRSDTPRYFGQYMGGEVNRW